MLSVYKSGKLIGLPFGKAGYGFIGNPASPDALSLFWTAYGENFIQNVIFLVDSIEMAQQWGKLNSLATKICRQLWPGNLVLHVPFNRIEGDALQEKLFDQNPELETALLDRSIYILVSDHPVTRSFLHFLQTHNYPPLLMGNFAQIADNFYAQDATTLVNEFGSEEVGVIMDVGRLQKGKKVSPATQVAIFDETSVQIEISGLITDQEIYDVSGLQDPESIGENNAEF